MREYGLKIDPQTPEDYQFGVSLPFEVLQDGGDWIDYLPHKELQNLNNIEPYACVSFTILNCIEILIKRKYGLEQNWSDRFLAAVSGTKEGGNSPKTVCQFLRKIGVVPQDVWPFDESVNTFEKFYEPLPPKLYELARDFLNEWTFRYELVEKDAISHALKCSPLGISVTAWHQKDGMYYKPEGLTDNHFTTLIAIKENEYKKVFDSYDSFIKYYDWNADHAVIQRYWIARNPALVRPNRNWFVEIWQSLGEFFADIPKIIAGK